MQRLAAVPALFLAASCGGEAAAGALATRADSAGVEIVTSSAASWRNGGGWRIDPAPVLEIGPRPDDDPRYDFLRVNSGTILPNGEIVVLVAGSSEIRFFDRSGAWLRSASRAGDGPGEMRAGAGLFHVQDTLFFRDQNLARVSAFSSSGAFLTSWSNPTVEGSGRIQPIHRLADGSWVGTARALAVSGAGAELPASGLFRPLVTYVRIAAGLNSVTDTIAITAGTEQYMRVSTSGGTIIEVSLFLPPLGRSAPLIVGDNHFVWGDNVRPELRIHGPDGKLERILRWNAPAMPADAALLDRMKQAALDRAPDNPRARQRVEDLYAVPIDATEVPYFTAIHRDPGGTLWVQDYAPMATDSVRFRVFHHDGQYLGPLALGPRHRVLEVGAEHLLTVWQDDDDVEYLRVYRVRRTGG